MDKSLPFDSDVLLQRKKNTEFIENLRRGLDRSIASTPTLALPSESASRPFGFVASEVEPLSPPPSIFIYEDIDYEKYKNYLPLKMLIPPPAATPPAYTSYPLSPIWTLEKNPAYLSGWCYTSSCSTSQKSLLLEKSRMNTIATPPEIVPIWNPQTKSFDFPEVPGMVQMVAGVSYSVMLDGNPNESLFVASIQTKETLLRYPGIGDEAVALLESLTSRVWGDAEKGIPPLYAIDGLQRNDRSMHPDPKSEARFTGSFSLAGTLEKGYAMGRTVPANQSLYKEGLEQRSQALMEMGRLYRLIAKICLPKNEYDLIDMHAIDNNAFSIGGLAPSPISVQMNVSFLINLESLIKHIGALSGKWHVDQLDALTIAALFLLFLRLPEGSDPGPFLLGRLGLYCREVGKGTWVISIMFRARDPHSGSSPWVGEGVEHAESLREELLKIKELWPAAELINRVGFVLYWSTEAVERNSALCASPETRFGNHGTLSAGLTRSLNFVDNGQHFLGTERDARSRLGWEHILNFYNALQLSGLNLSIPFGTLLSSITYQDSNTQTSKAIVPYPIDPSNPQQMEWVQLYRRYYKFLHILCCRYSLHLTKSHYLAQMKSLSEEVESSMAKFGLSEYLPIQSALNEDLDGGQLGHEDNESTNIEEPEPIPISQVLDRSVCRERGEVFWHVQLGDTQERMWVSHSDGKKWMFAAINRPVFLRFLDSNNISESSEVESFARDSNKMDAAHTLLSFTTATPTDGNSAQGSPSAITPVDSTLSRRSSARLPGQHDIRPVRSLPPPTHSKKRTEAPKLNATKRKVDNQSGNTSTPKRARLRDAAESEEESEGGELLFEIERITGHTFCKGVWMFSVVWKGYLRDDSCVSRDDLKESAPILYGRYAAQYPEVNVDKPPSDTEGSVSPALNPKGLDILLRIISVDALEDRLQQLEARYQAMTRLEQRKWPQKVQKTKQLYWEISELRQSYNRYHNILDIAPLSLNLASSPLELDQSIRATLLRASKAAKIMPLLGERNLADDIESAVLTWERARSYLILYDFVKKALPCLAEILFLPSTGVVKSLSPIVDETAADLNPLNDDDDTFSLVAPGTTMHLLLAPLVQHIIRYVEARRRDYRHWKRSVKSSSGTKTQGGRKKKDVRNEAMYITSNPLREIPSEVVAQLLPAPESSLSSHFLSPVLIAHPVDVIHESKQCFTQTIIDLFITPYLREATDVYGNKTMSSLDRCLVRGAVVHRIVAAAGSEGICASPAFAELLDRPHQLFDGNRAREDRLWSAVRVNEMEVLEPLERFLATHIDPNGISREAEHLGDFVRHHFLELQLGRYISEDEFYRNWSPSKTTRKAPGRTSMNEGPVTLSLLLPSKRVPHLGVLGLILREALNKERGWRCAHEGIFRCLNGQRPHDSRSVAGFNNPDHWNPFRHKTVATTLLKIKLPAPKLAGRSGLSNLLTFMGTGQGFRTCRFLGLSNAKDGMPDSYYSESVVEAQAVFEKAIQLNSAQMTSSGRWSAEEIREMAGDEKLGGVEENFYQISDQRIWGEPNQLLTARPQVRRGGLDGYVKLTLLQKLTPYWTEEIIQRWVGFLGPLLDQNPEVYAGQLHSFDYTLNFIHNLDLDGFRTGLTAFQTTINLSLLRLCLPPTLGEIAEFIAQNPGLGAYNGLIELGFSIANKSDICCALSMVHDHLLHHLSSSDQTLLLFGTHAWMFMEHILCKVSRYTNRVTQMQEWGEEAEKDGIWIQDRMNNACAFPIPLLGDPSRIEDIVKMYTQP